MKRGIAVGALSLLIPAVCLADAPSSVRVREGVTAPVAAVAPAPALASADIQRVLKVFKVFGDDDDDATGMTPRRSRKGRKSRGLKRAQPRKPRLAPAPAAEPGGILELLDGCPETLKM